MKKAKSFDELSSVGSLGTDGDTIGVLRTGTKDRANQIDDEELQSGPGLEAGLFGVLYTLKKDPVVCGWLASMVRLLLDPLQQLAVMLNPAFGWYAWMDWPGLGWIWAGLSYLDFARKIGQNAPYGVYEGVLYAFGALLLAVLGACVYIGVRLRRNHLMQMKNTWIVWLTTHVITLLLQTLFVANMGIPLLSMYCHWLVPASSGGDSTGSDAASSNSTTTNTTTGSSNTTVGLLNVTVAIANATLTNSSMSLNTTQTDAAASEPAYRRGYLNYYQDRSCSAFPQVLDLVLGVLIAVLYGLMTTLFTVADVDTNPLTDRLLAVVNPRVELFNLAAKTLFLLAGNVIVTDVQQLQALIFALCMAAQTFTVFRWLPHTIRITNYLRAGFKLGLTWVAILMVVLRFTQEKGDLTGDGTARITAIMLIGLPCAVVVGCLLARYRQHRWFYRGMRRFRNTLDTEHPKDVYKFWDIYEVEMLSRVCRTPGDVRGTQDSRMLKYADRIIRAGIALFPTSAYAHILYANFLIEVQSLYQAGQSQLMAARKLTPNFLERYALFMRQQQHMQRAHTSTTGESAVDLVTYVEFQRNYRLLLRATTRALLAQQSFWKLLQHSTLQFNALTSAFRNIEAAQEAALKTYRSVLERYPNSVKLLRSYAHFQEEVMNNPWRAAQIYEKADKLEEQQAAAQDYLLYANDSSMLTQVDDRNNAVAVINSSGIIQMTNKPLQQLFGYKASELEGQNVSILMPAPYCNRHNGYIAAYVSTGQARVVDTVREVVALHRRRHVFPIKLAVSKLSGQGADSQFLGVIRLVEVNTKVVRAYVMHNGITLCVEDRFEDIFGVSPAECIGRPFKDLVVEQDEAQSLMNSVREAGAPTSYGRAAGAGVTVRLHLQHKYAAPVLVDVSITAGGTPDEPLHVFSLAPIGGQAGGTSAGGAGSVPPALVSVPASAMVSTTALMVFNRGGNVVFASSSASAMLGYAHKSFLLMNLEALLPEHIKSLHAIGMRELMARKAAHSCRSGQTVFMAASNKALVPVRLSISHKAEGDDNLLTVVEAVRSSVDAGLDERRVKLEVGPTGEVLAVLSPASPVSLLGVAPVALVGSNLFKLVPELGKAAPTEQVQEEAVEELRVLCMKRMAPAYLRVVLGGGNAASPDGAGPGPVGGGGATAAGGTAPTAAAAANAASAATMAPAHAGVRLQASEQLAAIPEASEAAAGTARAAGPAAAGLSGVLLTEDDNEEALLQAAATAAATIHTYKPARQLPMSPAAARAAAAQQAAVRTADLPLSVPTAAAMPPPFLTGEAAGVLQPGFGPSARGLAAGQSACLHGSDNTLQHSGPTAIGPGPLAEATESAADPAAVGPAPARAELPSAAAALARLFSAGRRASSAALGPTDAVEAAAVGAANGFGPGQRASVPGARPSLSGASKPSLLRSGRDVGRRHQGTGVLGLLPHAVILEIDGTSGDANLVVSIWHPDKVASVLEVSREGDIRQAVLDELHPPGPLFGVGPTQLLQHNMKDLLGLSPRQSLLQYFYTSGNAVFSRGSASSLAQQAQQLQQAEGASAGPQGRRGPIDGSDVSSGGGAGNGEGAPGTSAAQRPSLLNPPTSSALRGGTEAKGVTIAAGGSTAAGGPSGAASNSGASLLSRRLPSPIVHVTVTHADGRPLHVLAQALPRRTSSHTFYVRLHLMPNAAHVQLGGTALVPAGLAGAAGGADAAAVGMAAGGISSRLAGLFGAGVLAPLVSHSQPAPTTTPAPLPDAAKGAPQASARAPAPQGACAPVGLQPAQSAHAPTPANVPALVGRGPAASARVAKGLQVAPSLAPAPFSLPPPSGSAASARRQILLAAAAPPTTATATAEPDDAMALPAGSSCRPHGSGRGVGEGGPGASVSKGFIGRLSGSGARPGSDAQQLSGVAMFSNHLFQVEDRGGEARADGRSSDEDAAARGDDRRRSAAPHSQGSLHPNRSAHGSGSANRTSGPGVAEAAASPGGAAATGAATASPVAFATGEGGPLSSHSLNGSEEPDPYDDITDPSEHDSDGEARASAFDSLGPAVDEARARRGHGEGDGSDSGDSTVRALRDTVVAPLAEIGRRTMRRGLDTSTSGIAIGGESAHAAEHRADEHDPADIHTEQAAAAPMSLEHPHPHSAEALGAAGVGPVFLREHAAAERQDQAAATAGGLGHQSLQPGLHSLYLQPPSGPAASLAQPASSGHAPSNHERPAVGSGPVSAAAAGAAAATCAASLGGRSRVPEHPTDRLRVAPSAGSVARLSEVALKRLARAAEADAAAAGKHSPRSVRNRDQLGTRAGGDGLSGVDAAARSSLTRRWIQSAGAAGPGRSSPDGVHGIAGVFGSPRGSGADFAAAGDDVRARSGLLEPAALPLNSPPGAGEPGRRGGISSGAPGYPGHVGRGAASVIPGPGTGAEGAPVEWGETTPAEDTDGQGQCRRLADPLQPPALLQQASSRRLTRRNTAANATAAAASGSAGGGFSSPPASEGASDDRSSSYSGAPGRGATEAEDEERHLDFQRGKRLRRIQKILERPESRKPIARFWRQSRIISVLLFLSHLACFVGIMVLLGDLKSCVSDIAASGLALEEVHSAALASRVLDLMHKNRTQDKLYRIEDMGTYERMMQTSVQGFEDRFVPAYRNFAAKHPQHLRKLARLWDDRVYPVDVQLAATASRSEATYVQQYMSLFEMGSWFQAYATEVAGNHNYTVQDIGYNLSDTRGFQFIHNAAVLDLVDAYIKVLDTNVEDCVDAAALTNDVMLSLLIVEACFICGCTAIYIMWRLMQVTKWRCALFGVFMSVPNPSIKALASRKISEDYDEDNSLVEGQAAGDGAQVTSQDRQPDTKAQAADADGVSKRVLGLAEQSGEAGGGSGDTRSRRAGGPGSPLEGSGGGGGAVPPGAEPPVGAAARSNWASPGPSRLRASFRDFAPPGVGLESDRGEGGDGKAGAGAGAIGRDTSASPTGLQGTKQAGAAGLPRGALVGAGTATKGPAPSSLQPSWRQRFNAWRDSVVRFFRTQYTRPGSRKVLAYNSVRNWWLCLPVVIWAILIITLYAVSYTLVTDLYEPIETVNIASFVVMRNTRLVYFAHEMCTLSDPALIPSYRRSLSDRRVIAGVEYDVLLYGDKYYNPAMLVNMSNGVHRIGKSSGIISSTSRIQQLLFFTQECLRSDQSTCLNRRSPLFQVTHSGVNALVTALFQTCDLLLDAPDAQINQNSIYLAAMFQIGLNDARDGLLTVQSHYIDSINNRIMRIAGLQIGLMAALLPLLIVFVFYLVRPFVKHIKEECNRMAIMLSELPQDADVVRMVEDAVGLGRAAAEARRKAKEAKRQARKAAALASKTIDAKKRPGLVRLPTGSFKY